MGFSVSASAAIIFISFLVAASTLYTAWDNSYTNVQAAREDWYNLKLSQLNTLVDLNGTLGAASIDDTDKVYNVTLYIEDYGSTMYVKGWSAVYDGYYRTIYNVSDDNVGFLKNYTYVLPGDTLLLNVTNIPLDSTHHNLTVIFDNGCWLRIGWYYNGSAVLITDRENGCPTEVS
ncbi:flagella [Thermococcus sp.]|uniref:flagella n=1 Tax=Thermococcus sp. TaxID=35749 RepID=UPI00261C6C3D|nr:flagella [Thermococcus sp.]